MPSLLTLCKIAGISGIVVGTTGYALGYKFKERIRNTTIYKTALAAFYSHEKAVDHLGVPIKEGAIDFGDRKDGTRHFSVNLKGSKTNGQLNCDLLLSQEDKEAKIIRLEIKFGDIPNKVFVISEDMEVVQ